jgi:hypothetical protein
MKIFISCILAGVVLVSLNCTGPQGPTGPQGEKGDQGVQGPTGSSNIVAYYGGDFQSITLYRTPTISRTISIDVDGPGTIIYEASGYFYYNGSTNPYSCRASLSLNTSMSVLYLCVVNGNSSIAYNPYYVSRSRYVSSAGTYTAYLLGDLPTGDTGVVGMAMNNVIASFYPD